MPEEVKSDGGDQTQGVIGAVGVREYLAKTSPSNTKPFKIFIEQFKIQSFQVINKSHVKIYRLEDKKQRYLEFVKDLFGLSDQQAKVSYDDVLSRHFKNAAGREKYADRPKGEDAVSFYSRVWGKDLSNGRADRLVILHHDPTLIDAVRNRCNYLVREKGGSAFDYYPPFYPPPLAGEATLPEEVLRKRKAERERQSSNREKSKPRPK